MSKRSRQREIEAAIDSVNRKTDEDFAHGYLSNSPIWTSDWSHPKTGNNYQLSLSSLSRTLTTSDLEACFSLVEETSRHDYENSSRGWNPSAKRKEMRDPDLRYILVRDSSSRVQAFTSMMPTIEEGQPVVYCYEIHLKAELRGIGLAKLLMRLLETVTAGIEVTEKVMLTVFTSNERAVDFYRRCGFERDEISPQPRRLRGGNIKLPDYEILSKKAEGRLVGAEHGDAHVTGAQNSTLDATSQEIDAIKEARPAKMARLDHAELIEDDWETDEA